MFISEAPGAEEDKKGIPFVGEAGVILNNALKEVGINRENISITNICVCRPPENRPPAPKEIDACFEFLEQEIKELKPELIVLLGNTPLKKFLKGVGGITRVRGKWFSNEEYNCKILPVFHPAYILRNPQEKDKLVNDLKQVKNFLDGTIFSEEKISTTYKVAYNLDQFNWIIEQLHKQELWSFDTETTGLDFDKDDIFILTFSWQEATAVLIDLRLFEDKDYIWRKLKEVFENKSKKVAQNGSFDIEFLLFKGIVVNNYYCDTILEDYLLNENRNHGLEILAEEYTDMRGYDQPLQQYKLQNKIKNYAISLRPS
jgi:DNA polymerase